MRRVWGIPRIIALIVAIAAMTVPAACKLGALQDKADTQDTAAPQAEPTLTIENDSELPGTYPGAQYEVHFHARGGVPVLHWHLEKGALPRGFKLEDSGLLHGQTDATGEFQFTVSVRDGSQPQQAFQKGFTLHVRSALSVDWKTAAHVNGSRIEGSVAVSNTTPDDVDLTFVATAVARNGRATAIGYQHFVLKRGTVDMELPFGENLPFGGYVVHVDVVGEVPGKKAIYRNHLQTPSQLHVQVGP